MTETERWMLKYGQPGECGRWGISSPTRSRNDGNERDRRGSAFLLTDRSRLAANRRGHRRDDL